MFTAAAVAVDAMATRAAAMTVSAEADATVRASADATVRASADADVIKIN